MPFFSCSSHSYGREGVGPTSLSQGRSNNCWTELQDKNMAGESAGERGMLSMATQQELQTGASSQGTRVGTKGELKIAFNPL